MPSKTRHITRCLVLCLSVFGMLLFALNTNPVFAQQKNTKPKLAALKVTGPYTSGNLAVYLIHGKNQIKHQKFLTLNEAMLKGKVVVHETSNVNQLAVENIGNVAVFIQSGEVVKGGKQDRTLQHDMILPPKSGKVPVKSFCVESGRWNTRKGESSKRFSGSNNFVPSKGIKLAAKSKPSQRKVWNAVSSFQNKYVSKGYRNAKSRVSPSSLQLTMEAKAVKKLSKKYVTDLKPVVKDKPNAIGYAFAINGKLNSADVYASSGLFRKLWPKLMLASAQEAAAEDQKGKTFTPPESEAVMNYLKTSNQGKTVKQKLSADNVYLKRETAKSLYSESRTGKTGSWVHKNYLTK